MHGALRAESLRRSGALFLLPVLALIGLVAVLFLADPLQNLTGAGPPVEEFKVERFLRDAKLIEIGGGTLEAHQKNLTKDLMRFRQA